MITLEPVEIDQHTALLHGWVTHPRSVYWQMQDATPADVAHEYARIAESPHHDAFLGRVDGSPAFLAETYDPAHSELAGASELRPGDLGMHVLVAPTDQPVAGFTRRVLAAVMTHCFVDPAVRRVVVEPDVRNGRIATLNAEAGFRVVRELPLSGKTAALSFATRSDFLASPLSGRTSVDHLTPELLERAQRHLVTKALSEFTHERLLSPERHGDRWRVTSPAGDTTYTFAARRHALEHWSIDPATVVREIEDEPAPLDVQQLVVDFADELGIPDTLLATYVEELASTLASTAWKLRHRAVPVADLVDADHQAIEAAMTEGHPAFVANNGRIGFGIDDYEQWAPETGRTTRLVWVAARRSLTHLSLGAGLTEESLYAAELGRPDRERFAGVLTGLGLDPRDYLLLPMHPWQWRQKVTVTFAPDVARRDLVLLGEGTDEMAPQQSIRTFANRSEPGRSFVKTALAIQNMGFVRGLSPAYMTHTPAINDWVARLVDDDETLRECGFSVLREHAAIGYTGDAFHALGSTSPQRKMVAALWRESAQPRLRDGERLMTMAALLHRDHERAALVTALVAASGLEPAAWVSSYLRAYVRPVVHCLLAHDLAFMPHGENLVLVLRDHVPVRAVMKDIGEEVAVMRPGADLPDDVARIRVDVPAEVRPLALHTDVFDGFLRHLAAILDDDGVLAEGEFWQLVGECVADHAADHPDLGPAVAAYDLFTPSFAHSCLNRLQLRNTLQMVDLSDQAESLICAGTLPNPIAPAG